MKILPIYLLIFTCFYFKADSQINTVELGKRVDSLNRILFRSKLDTLIKEDYILLDSINSILKSSKSKIIFNEVCNMIISNKYSFVMEQELIKLLIINYSFDDYANFLIGNIKYEKIKGSATDIWDAFKWPFQNVIDNNKELKIKLSNYILYDSNWENCCNLNSFNQNSLIYLGKLFLDTDNKSNLDASLKKSKSFCHKLLLMEIRKNIVKN